jgi:hypothetical protein
MSRHRHAGAVSPEVIVREFLLASQGRARSGPEMAMYIESELNMALGDEDIGWLDSILAKAGNCGDGGAGDTGAAHEGAVAAILALVSGAGSDATPRAGAPAGTGGSEPNGHG